ncbi:unnamed protein product [Allacma fusca]|uniref:Uncharacterized protein n=1 Tax=Allacma fusca TaxID=39272 RepID=A0A8J2NU45_9HEXA|nr:unnamed protein product [Allacma fusca]
MIRSKQPQDTRTKKRDGRIVGTVSESQASRSRGRETLTRNKPSQEMAVKSEVLLPRYMNCQNEYPLSNQTNSLLGGSDSLEQLLDDIVTDRCFLHRIRIIQDLGNLLERIKMTMKYSSNHQFISQERATKIIRDINQFGWLSGSSTQLGNGIVRQQHRTNSPKGHGGSRILPQSQSSSANSKVNKISSTILQNAGYGSSVKDKGLNILNECNRALDELNSVKISSRQIQCALSTECEAQVQCNFSTDNCSCSKEEYSKEDSSKLPSCCNDLNYDDNGNQMKLPQIQDEITAEIVLPNGFEYTALPASLELHQNMLANEDPDIYAEIIKFKNHVDVADVHLDDCFVFASANPSAENIVDDRNFSSLSESQSPSSSTTVLESDQSDVSKLEPKSQTSSSSHGSRGDSYRKKPSEFPMKDYSTKAQSYPSSPSASFLNVLNCNLHEVECFHFQRRKSSPLSFDNYGHTDKNFRMLLGLVGFPEIVRRKFLSKKSSPIVQAVITQHERFDFILPISDPDVFSLNANRMDQIQMSVSKELLPDTDDTEILMGLPVEKSTSMDNKDNENTQGDGESVTVKVLDTIHVVSDKLVDDIWETMMGEFAGLLFSAEK